MSRSNREADYIPEVIVDANAKKSYKKGSFLGKGGFAKCYEMSDLKSGQIFAGKVVPKRLLKTANQKEKMTSEIKIHKQLKHQHIVQFNHFFDDDINIYILLELCRKRSMMELHRRRKAVTEPEARYFMKQILDGVGFLHRSSIIHRDLKLGNLFLDDNLQVKIGDFGLAAKIEFNGERKKTLCGTPNYLAPEVLNKEGHSFEVDMWSIGCILYTLLVGKPPFETNTLKETYSRIKNCQYIIPTTIAQVAESLIQWLLQPDPKKRPKVEEAARHEWFSGYTPTSLPASVLVSAPRFPAGEDINMKMHVKCRRPLGEVNNGGNSPAIQGRLSVALAGAANAAMVSQFEVRRHMEKLVSQLRGLTRQVPILNDMRDEDSDPASKPLVWISKWVDYSDKYGFGFQLIDGTWGVLFNDTTKIVMLANEINFHYIHRNGREEYFTKDVYPPELQKKVRLLIYFRRYMHEHLMTAGSDVVRDVDSVSRTPYLYQWFRNTRGIFMCLTNGTVQVNFIDHTKIILCPLMGAVTYVNADKVFRTYRFSSLEEKGCNAELAEALRYAYAKLNNNLKSVLATR